MTPTPTPARCRMSDAPDFPARVNEITSVRIRLASPDDIRGWSHGEVTHHDFLKEALDDPHPAGLFSEHIFGPLNDWCCACRLKNRAKYWGPAARGTKCPQCNVCVDSDDVRRRRLGHIELALPVVHPWFLHSRPSPLALLLGLRPGVVEEIANYQAHVIRVPGDTGLAPGVCIS